MKHAIFVLKYNILNMSNKLFSHLNFRVYHSFYCEANIVLSHLRPERQMQMQLHQ